MSKKIVLKHQHYSSSRRGKAFGWLTTIVVLVVAGLIAFGYFAKRSGPAAAPVTAQEDVDRHAYSVQGEVMELDQKLRLATVKHGDISGWMPAMTMQFPVHNDADWKALSVGAKIVGTVYVDADGFYLADVHPAPAGQQ